MEIPVLIEPIQGNGYLARTGSPFDWAAEGATAEEAVQRLLEVATARVAAGTRLTAIAVPDTAHPYAPLVGSLKNHPLFEDWRRAVEEYREEGECDPDGRSRLLVQQPRRDSYTNCNVPRVTPS
ncbi:MAG: hypothetical protein JWO38_5441 [Gemmataceae bacterium]|nr:hypothetical protein [Gemmataceae bacterium]